MNSQKLYFSQTDRTLKFLLDPFGEIRIRGRGLIHCMNPCYHKVKMWISEYLNDPAEVTVVDISVDYINNFNSGYLIMLLIKLSEVKSSARELVIKWYYEDGDEDILERGEHILLSTGLPIVFIRVINNQYGIA